MLGLHRRHIKLEKLKWQASEVKFISIIVIFFLKHQPVSKDTEVTRKGIQILISYSCAAFKSQPDSQWPSKKQRYPKSLSGERKTGTFTLHANV